MNLRTLILRSLRFHLRAHLGVLLGATLGSAILIGALLVGDSVRGSLRDMALARLGKVEAAMATGDRLFRAELATNLNAAPVLALPGTANSADGSRRANRVHVLGVDESFWKLAAKAPAFTAVPPDSVVLNQPLAEQLAAKPGDEVLLRVSKVSALSQDVALTTRDGQTVALRLRVHAVVGAEELGRFSLQANQVAPFNAFVPLGLLQNKASAAGRANLAATAYSVKVPANLKDSTPPVKLKEMDAAPFANALLPSHWNLQDAQLELHQLTNSAVLELRSQRIFLDRSATAAVGAIENRVDMIRRTTGYLPPGKTLPEFIQQPILTYLATLLRAGTNATAYPMVTAAGAPLVPADLRDDEIVVNQWLADQLQLKPGGELELFYFLPDSGARLTEATNRFRVRSIVPMQMPWADRTLMPDFPGIASAERIGDWDAGFPLTHRKLVDDPYWKQWRGTPKAFVSLSAGRKMWANRFGDTTAVRFPVGADVRRLTSTSTNTPSTNQSETPHVVSYKAELEKSLLAALKPADFGLVFQPVREQALKASREGQDFGGLFIGFSFFLIVAACVLVALLFQFGVEQRAKEVGTLLALGFTPKQVRRLLLGEGAGLAVLGAALGAVGAVWYARAMLHGLSTVWRDAVGTSDLRFHAEPATLAGGFVGAVAVAVFSLWLALRKQVRQPARVLLAGGGEEVISNQFSVVSGQVAKGNREVAAAVLPHPSPLPLGEGTASATALTSDASGSDPANSAASPSQARTASLPLPAGEGRGEGESVVQPAGSGRSVRTRPKSLLLSLSSLLLALSLLGWALATGQTANAGAFFGAGALLLIAALAGTSALLTRLERSEAAAALTVASLGIRNTTRRRSRSLATATMLACGSFLVLSIGVFRLDENANATKRSSGTGGFALLGESTLPVVQDLNTKAGREALGLDESLFVAPRFSAGPTPAPTSPVNIVTTSVPVVRVVPFRVRDGDDASCLNLNRAQKPRLLGVKPELLWSRGAFQFASDPEGLLKGASGWIGLERQYNSSMQGDEIPAIADLNSILWAMGKKVGDIIEYPEPDERGRPVRLRLVGAVANSILQGNLIIAEDEFTERFPSEAGYRYFLVDAPTNRVADVSATLTRALRDFGLELTPATRRMAQLNAVQNTYLGTFQILGGLGLLLGSAGLGVVVLRNVLERRGELALLLALGFRAKALRWLVLSEHAALLLLGLLSGVVAAGVAVLPSVLGAGELPVGALALTLGGVLVSGLVWTWLATVSALRGQLLDALRNQ